MTWLGQVDADTEASERWILELALASSPTARATVRARIVKLDGLADANWKDFTSTDARSGEVPR